MMQLLSKKKYNFYRSFIKNINKIIIPLTSIFLITANNELSLYANRNKKD